MRPPDPSLPPGDNGRVRDGEATSDPEDEAALRWAGDEETGREGAGWRSHGPADESGADPDAARIRQPEGEQVGQRGRFLVAVAFAVPYLIWTVCWILVVQRVSSGAGTLGAEILWQFGEFLAILSPPLWFAATVALTRTGRARVRVGWFLIGLAVLLPWPIVFGVVVAASAVGAVS